VFPVLVEEEEETFDEVLHAVVNNATQSQIKRYFKSIHLLIP
jgi:hypothetical protein